MTAKLLAVLLPALIHGVIGNFIEPLVFGDSLELHPVVVLLSLAFWYALWGLPGAILSVPITAVLRIVLTNSAHPYAISAANAMNGKFGVQMSTSSAPRRRR
jgi:predicted PurR-regulated permease PerM